MTYKSLGSNENGPSSLHTAGPLDETFGQHAAFPIITTDLEENGHDKYTTFQVNNYLHKVRQEAENDKCFHYTDRDKQDIKHTHEMEIDEKLSSVHIDKKWSQQLMSKFLSLKQIIKQETSICQNSKASHFDNMIIPQSASAWRTFILQNLPPSVEFFYAKLDHPTIIKLIIYFTKWLSINTPESLSKWIFIVFLRLDNLLDYTETSIVRDLGKKARKLADKIHNNEQEERDTEDDTNKDYVENLANRTPSSIAMYTIDMVLVIVGEYYGQKDLLI